MLLLYYVIILIVILTILVAYFKLKYPFWSRQPVFHYHKLNYWMFPPILQHHANTSEHHEAMLSISLQDPFDSDSKDICQVIR